MDGSAYFECFVTYELKVIVISMYSLSLNMGNGGLFTLLYSTFDICRMCSVTDLDKNSSLCHSIIFSQKKYILAELV